MKNILITGGGGFIARNLINRLVVLGINRIICLDNREIEFYPETVRCIRGSFSDRRLLCEILPGIDTVVHLGSNALPANSDYVTDVEQNLLGSITLIKECENAKVKKIIFASSGGTVYGPNASIPTREDSPCSPICSYGIIKVAIENYLKLATHSSGMQTITLRIANPYGPWQNWNGVQGAVSVFCHKIANKRTINLYGDGSIVRDFIYIDDVIDMFIKALESPKSSGSFNVGSGEGHSMLDLIYEVEQLLDIKAHVAYLPTRGCDVPVSYLDIKKACQEFNWGPKTPFRNGIKKTLSWQINNPNAF